MAAHLGTYTVSARGQLSLPAEARRRWGLEEGGPVEIVDLGDAALLVPGGFGAAVELPPTIGLVSLRDLSWPMAEILTSISANLLTLEALAAAQHLQAKIVVAKRNDGPQLRRHAQQLAISVRSI
jgi:AbrB family looped-hinge helix DNA binding protein